MPNENVMKNFDELLHSITFSMFKLANNIQNAN